MKRTIEEVRQNLNALKLQLEEITYLSSRACNHHFHRSYARLYSGSVELAALHFTYDQYRLEIINLHSKYLNAFPVLLGVPVPEELVRCD